MWGLKYWAESLSWYSCLVGRFQLSGIVNHVPFESVTVSSYMVLTIDALLDPTTPLSAPVGADGLYTTSIP